MTASPDWLDQARRLLDVFVQGQDTRAATGKTGTGAAHDVECSWCPLCQAAAVVRGERPEVTAALADVLTAAATALRGIAENGSPARPGPPGAQETGPQAEPPPAVQRIEIV